MKTSEAIEREIEDVRTFSATDHRFRLGGQQVRLVASYSQEGTVCRIQLSLERGDPALQGMLDVFSSTASLALEGGVPLAKLIEHLRHVRFPPNGWTNNPDLPRAASVVDYACQWLASREVPTARCKKCPGRTATFEEGVAMGRQRSVERMRGYIQKHKRLCGEARTILLDYLVVLNDSPDGEGALGNEHTTTSGGA